MKRILAFGAVALAALTIAACNPTTPQVAGSFDGEWADIDDPVRIALVSYASVDGPQYDDDQPQLADVDAFDAYTVSLPPSAPEGLYAVEAYEDVDGDGRVDAGERRGNSEPEYLYYSADGDGEYEAGWNGQSGINGDPYTAALYDGYDISREF